MTQKACSSGSGAGPTKRFKQTTLNFSSSPSARLSHFTKSNTEAEVHSLNPFTTHFKIRLNPVGDGSCQFVSMSDQLSTAGIVIPPEELRLRVVSFLADEGSYMSSFIPYDWKVYLANMSQCHTYGDHLTLQSVANIYDVNFVVISSLGPRGTRLISSSADIEHQRERPNLLLGHYAETDECLKDHFVSLSWSGTSDFNAFLECVRQTAADITETDDVSQPAVLSSLHDTEPCSIFTGQLSQSSTKDVDLSGTIRECAVADIAQLPTDALARPVLPSYRKTAFGNQNRSFSTTLYEKYSFIEYSVLRDAVYCFPCRFFGNKSGHSQEISFTVKGFNNWKKCERLLEHSNCKHHKDSVVAWMAYKSTAVAGSVVQQQIGYHASLVRENREYMKSLARIALFCGRQNIALRGHDECADSSNKGNFLELADLVAVESKEFQNRKQSMASNATYLSPDSQNSLLESAARCVLASINVDMKKAGMYAIITDCCTDMVADNLSVCVRFVDMETGIVHERFIQFTDLSADELDATSITGKITSVLQQKNRFEVSVLNCVAQASDGASVMSGKDNGVQKLFRDIAENPCIFVHCYAHRLNLVLSVSSTEVQSSKEFFDLIRKTIGFINVSVKRKAIFTKLQTSDPARPHVLVLPDLCDHKWNFRERAVSVVHSRFSYLLQTLDSIAEDGKSDERFEAECILTQLMKPANICLLVIMSDIFNQLGPLSDVLQAEKCNISLALQLATAHLKILQNKRCDEYFHKIWLIVSDLANKNGAELSVPVKRTRKVPSRLNDCVTDSTLGHSGLDATEINPNPEVHYRSTIFFPVMDRVIQEMERRFSGDMKVPLLKSLSACHPDSAEFLDIDVLRPLVEAYNLDSRGKLMSQIEVCKLLIEETSKPGNISDLIAMLVPAKGFPDLRRLLQLALTVPVANVAAERSFSSMRKIRTYIRSTMTEQRLSCIALLSIESELTNSIDVNQLVDIFAKLPSLRDTTGELATTNVRRLEL